VFSIKVADLSKNKYRGFFEEIALKSTVARVPSINPQSEGIIYLVQLGMETKRVTGAVLTYGESYESLVYAQDVQMYNADYSPFS
jgi:hypothetical protein